MITNVQGPTSTRRGYVTLAGKTFTGDTTHSVTVMMNDDVPLVTDGYAIWNTIDRPLARGVTVFAGYNPTQLTFGVRFGQWDGNGWDQSEQAGKQTENDCITLGWMGGGGFRAGPPPVVYVNCIGPFGRSDLVPLEYQESYPWVIGGISWSSTAYRNSHGDRIWQEASVTLMQYTGYETLPTTPSSPAPTGSSKSGPGAKKDKDSSGLWVISTPQLNTPFKLAGHDPDKKIDKHQQGQVAHRTHRIQERYAQIIIKDPRNEKVFHGGRGGIHQKIKPGTKVWFPAGIV